MKVSHWSLSDSKSSQVSRILFGILSDSDHDVLWMLSTRPRFFFKSSCSFISPLMTVPRTPITIGIVVTFMFCSFLTSLARSWYFPSFSLSFNFTLISRNGKIHYSVVSIYFSFICRSGHLPKIRWSVCISKSQIIFCVSGWILSCAYYYYHYFTRFFRQRLAGDFCSSLSDIKSLQLFWTLLNILAHINHNFVWTVGLPSDPHFSHSLFQVFRHFPNSSN